MPCKVGCKVLTAMPTAFYLEMTYLFIQQEVLPSYLKGVVVVSF